MNVVDSSAWLEYFAGGSNARHFAAPLADTEALVVPSISVYEVFKAVLSRRGEHDALRVVAQMRRATVVELDSTLALAAARLSLTHQLPLADAVILATARAQGATLWTQDADFEGLPEVRYYPRR